LKIVVLSLVASISFLGCGYNHHDLTPEDRYPHPKLPFLTSMSSAPGGGPPTLTLTNASNEFRYTFVSSQIVTRPPAANASVVLDANSRIPVVVAEGLVHFELTDPPLNATFRPPWWVVRNHTAIAGADGTKFIFQTVPETPSFAGERQARVIWLSGGTVRYGHKTVQAGYTTWVEDGKLPTPPPAEHDYAEYGPGIGNVWGWTTGKVANNPAVAAVVQQAQVALNPTP